MREKLIKALNEDLAEELAAITQYMWHHVMAKGLASPDVRGIFHRFAMEEMHHAESLAERIDSLGGTPTPQPGKILMGGELRKMIADDLEGEHGAVKRYKEHIKLADAADDVVTRRMLEEILADEVGHVDELSGLLEK